MPEIFPAYAPALSKREQQLLKTKPPSFGFGEFFHTTDSGFFIQSLLGTDTKKGWEPTPGEKYGATQSGAFYKCQNDDRMRAGEFRMEEIEVDGKPTIVRIAPQLDAIKADLDRLIAEAGLTFVSSHMDHYALPPEKDYDRSGYTYKASIGESAVTIHTWPGENGESYFDFVIHVCNSNGSHHEEKFDALYDRWVDYFGNSGLPEDRWLNPIQFIPHSKPE